MIKNHNICGNTVPTHMGGVTIMVLIDKKLHVKYVSSFVIGDGCLALGGKRNNNARYHLHQRHDHKDYVDYQANILENICPVNVVLRTPNNDDGWNRQPMYALTSRSLPFFTTLRNRWYLEGKKVVSPHDLKLFDAESMAHLYMDDGCLSVTYNKSTNRQIVHLVICTQSFSWADNDLLRRFILERFDVQFTINKASYPSGIKYRLRANKENAKRFVELVTPYVLPSFEYKITIPNE